MYLALAGVAVFSGRVRYIYIPGVSRVHVFFFFSNIEVSVCDFFLFFQTWCLGMVKFSRR